LTFWNVAINLVPNEYHVISINVKCEVLTGWIFQASVASFFVPFPPLIQKGLRPSKRKLFKFYI
jgi:hypothetical protein